MRTTARILAYGAHDYSTRAIVARRQWSGDSMAKRRHQGGRGPWGGIDVEAAADSLRERIMHIPNVLTTPSAAVEILTFSPAGATLTARPYCFNERYWQVYFDTNRAISRMFAPAHGVTRI
jgi:hypothetical protein